MTAANFRGLIERAIQHGGSYYLTYHRWASRRQVQICYPEFKQFLERKMLHDPHERFQSEWYRHYKTMFAEYVERIMRATPSLNAKAKTSGPDSGRPKDSRCPAY